MMFFDAVMRGPMIATFLMSLSASLVGVLLFVRKRSLIGEALSHASYPGVTCAIFVAPFVRLDVAILIGAFITALLGFLLINFLQKKLRVFEDGALCFVIATFFGIASVLASVVQKLRPALYGQINAYLYGQAATMSDEHIYIYAALTSVVILLLLFFYRRFYAASFDPSFSAVSGLSSKVSEALFLGVVTLSVIVGIRSVGVILMAALLIAPPLAARQFTNRLSRMLVLSAFVGTTSGTLGVMLSVGGLPTGPMIVIIASLFALLSLLFAPKRGVVACYWRSFCFQRRTHFENQLKALWHKKPVSLTRSARLYFFFKGFVSGGKLTESGERKGAYIVRLHRLWEAYLVYSLGMSESQVHTSAEAMEHVLTPELEEELTKLLSDPKMDPHAQPIPTREEFA